METENSIAHTREHTGYTSAARSFASCSWAAFCDASQQTARWRNGQKRPGKEKGA